jgi:glycosyltransferase involved in cell wall biosynthesis
MRVVMLSKACVVGQYQTKLEELAKQNIELTVVVPPFWRDERGLLALERVHTRGYTMRVEPMRFNGQFHLHYYPTFARVLAELRPHIVHIDEEPYNLATFLAMRAARRVNAKTLFFTWQNILRRYPPPFAWMEAYVLRHADHTLAGNRDAADVLRAKGYRGTVSVIPQFGVNPADFSITPPRDAGKFRIGYAGRLVPEKGVDILLRAVAGLSGDWSLGIVGSGPELAKLESLAHKLNIAERVKFERWRASTAMPAFYGQLDALVVPSRTRANWKEQFGRVLIEAMAAQVPVIGSTCGEIPNVIGDAGLIFPEGDVTALRVHLTELQNNLALRTAWGERGRARVLAHFTQARIAQATASVYRQMR